MMEVLPIAMNVAIMVVVCYVYGWLSRRAGYERGLRDGRMCEALHQKALRERERRPVNRKI